MYSFNINSNNLIICSIFIGVFLCVYQWSKSSVMCDGPKVVYKYLPRDFNVDRNYPDGVSRTFKDLFANPTPYIVNLGNDNKRVNV